MNFQIYTDGACSGNPGPGGIGYVILLDGKTRITHGSEGYRRTTNNRMEILAVIEAVRRFWNEMRPTLKWVIGEQHTVTVCTDSDIVYGTMVKKYKRKVNKDLWTRLDEVLTTLRLEGVEIAFEKVDGHSGVKWNEEADQLAVTGRMSDNKGRDEVYEQEHPDGENPGTASASGEKDSTELIKSLFLGLDDRQKVGILVSLYWRLRDAQKDEFLRETDNQ